MSKRRKYLMRLKSEDVRNVKRVQTHIMLKNKIKNIMAIEIKQKTNVSKGIRNE